MTTAVVVGSGPNGLAAAIRLAEAGLDVTVFEAAAVAGGGMRSSELTVPGLIHDECAAFHPTGAASPYLSTLGLEAYGLEWLWPELEFAHPLDDGTAGFVSQDMGITGSSLGADAGRWRSVFEPLAEHFPALVDDVFRPIAGVPTHPFLMAGFGLKALRPATWMANTWKHDQARALYMGVAAHKFGALTGPLSGSVGVMLTAAAHAVGWPVARGGSKSIAEAMVAKLANLGGEVRTSTTITSLRQITDLMGGVRPEVIMLDTAPAGVLQIVGDELPGRVRRALTRYSYGPAAFKLDLAIEGEIPWTNSDVGRAGTVHLGGTAEEMVATEAMTGRGEMPDRPFVLLGQQYLADPSRSTTSATGTTINPVYAYAHVPHDYQGDASDLIIDQIERFAPGLRDRIIGRNVRSAPEMAAYNANYVGGDISAGENSARQIAMRPRVALNPYALGVPGIYLCSSATPPGAGVHGMGGFNAAERALKKIR